jgi:hypothetical protein
LLLAGLWSGLKLYGKLDEAAFREVMLGLLLVAGLALIVRRSFSDRTAIGVVLPIMHIAKRLIPILVQDCDQGLGAHARGPAEHATPSASEPAGDRSLNVEHPAENPT